MFRNAIRVKRLMVLSAMLAVAFAWTGREPARAQAPAIERPPTNDDGDPQEPPDREAHREGDPDRERDPNRERETNRERGRRAGDPRETLAKLQKLRLAMHKELELSPEQRDTAEALFEAHFKSAPQRYAEDMEKKQEELQTRAEEIREQMDEAAGRGDAEGARRLRRAHAELFRNAFRADIDATADLLIELRESLDQTQQKKFDALVRKLGLSFAIVRSGGMAPIGEQLRNPALGLSDEQRAAIDRLTKDAMDELADPDLDPEDRREILYQLREDILAQLTDEQNRRIEEDTQRYHERQRQREEALEQLRKQKEAAKAESGGSTGEKKDEPPQPD
jgi:hypothetical protein